MALSWVFQELSEAFWRHGTHFLTWSSSGATSSLLLIHGTVQLGIWCCSAIIFQLDQWREQAHSEPPRSLAQSGCLGVRGGGRSRTMHPAGSGSQMKPLAKQQWIVLLNLQCIYSMALPAPHCWAINVVQFLVQLSLLHSRKCYFLILYSLSNSPWLIGSVNDVYWSTLQLLEITWF